MCCHLTYLKLLNSSFYLLNEFLNKCYEEVILTIALRTMTVDQGKSLTVLRFDYI